MSDSNRQGDYIAYWCGDTFIDFEELCPTEQWSKIYNILQYHNFDIVIKETKLTLVGDMSEE